MKAMEKKEYVGPVSEQGQTPEDHICKVTGQGARKKVQNKTCYRCGSPSHTAEYKACPAANKLCRKCNRKGHFAAVCKGGRCFNVVTIHDDDEYVSSEGIRKLQFGTHGLDRVLSVGDNTADVEVGR